MTLLEEQLLGDIGSGGRGAHHTLCYQRKAYQESTTTGEEEVGPEEDHHEFVRHLDCGS